MGARCVKYVAGMTSPAKSPAVAATLPRNIVNRYAVGSIGTGGFSTLPGLVLVYYLTDALAVTALVAGIIVTIAKVWDVVIDPVIGGLSDRTLARTGSRRGPMVIGALLIPVLFVVMFAVPAGTSQWVAAVWVFLAYTAAATAFSLFQVPFTILPAELTGNYHERTRLLTWRVVVLTFAILLFGAGGPMIRDRFDNVTTGYLVMAIVSAVLIGLGLWTASTIAPRGVATPSVAAAKAPLFSTTHYKNGITVLRESQPLRALLGAGVLQALAIGVMLACGQYVATHVLNKQGLVMVLFIALVAPAIVFAPIWQWASKRVGKERAYTIATCVYFGATLVMGAMMFAPGLWIVAPLAVAGAAYAGLQSLPYAMLPDIITHDAKQSRTKLEKIETDVATGEGRAGIFGGVWTAGETMGLALGTSVLTIVLAVTGYTESSANVTVTQPASAVTGISFAFSVLPAVLMALSLVLLRRYTLREADITERA